MQSSLLHIFVIRMMIDECIITCSSSFLPGTDRSERLHLKRNLVPHLVFPAIAHDRGIGRIDPVWASDGQMV
jgi:hypothetical protein